MIGPRTRSSGTRSVPKRKRSSWYSSRRFSVRDLDRPLMVDQRAQEVVQPDERLPHARVQEDAVVEGAALAALVAPDVRLPDGLRPVDHIEERDGLVADGLEAGERHLDELPLDEVDEALIPSGRPCQRFGERRRAVGGGPRPEPLDHRHDLSLPAAGSAALAERGSCPGAGVRPVELDDLHGKLPRGEEVGRGAVRVSRRSRGRGRGGREGRRTCTWR